MDSFSMFLNPYMNAHQQSSIVEILALSTLVPLLFVMRHSLGFNYHHHNGGGEFRSRSLWIYFSRLAVDFVFLIVPMLLIFTVLEEQTYTWTVILGVLLLLFGISKRFVGSSTDSKSSESFRANITSYRVIVMEVACLCILAVDFEIFPRRHAKSRMYGISLMDLGVGSFALTNAVVSKQARGISSLSLKDASGAIIPPLAVGFGRLILTKSVHYGVPAGEYGVHWNFFFTLAALAMLASFIRIPTNYSAISGLLILIGYQCWLSKGSNSYLLSNTRGDDIISQNKEGLFSLFGFWGMYLIGIQLGNYLFFGRQLPSSNNESNKWIKIKISCLSVIFWLITIALDKYVESISRRMCNLAYVTLILAENLQLLAILMVSDSLRESSKTSTLEEAVNRNLLATFLVANVLTGLVNMLMDTKSASPMVALSILLAYAFLTSIAASIPHFYGFRLKFW
ncbi:unnamed protein product [Linum trigynum]|uniref:Phosphatidylinositol-glycan biosynthesis class W protein n=1 Tax=Linum trigynum TaxID=586398 RepID=A0AAV2GI05_9ROSI